MGNKAIRVLYLLEIFSGMARGSYLVCIGWTTLVISDSVATVGQIFIVASITNVLAGPLIGVLIDRHKRKQLIILSQILLALPIAGVGFILLSTGSIPVWGLFLIAVVVNFFRLMYQGAFDGLLRFYVEDSDMLTTVARARGIHLFSAALGTIIIGLIIEHFSPGHAFIACALTSICLILVAVQVPDGIVKANSLGFGGFWMDLKGGLKIFTDNRLIRIITLTSIVALPIGQLSNALLSSFVRDDLGQGSDFFAAVDAAWPLGGMIAAALLSNKIKKLGKKDFEFLLAFLAGVTTVVFSFASDFLSLAVLHGLMGFFVWSCRIILGSRVLEICDNTNVGRTRIYIESLVSLSAMIMNFSPSVISFAATATYFLMWGIFISISTFLLWLWKQWYSAEIHWAQK